MAVFGSRSGLLLEGGTLVTMNPAREVGLGDLLIEGGRIAEVGAVGRDRGRFDQAIDCAGRFIIPGLVQPHTHLCQTLCRGSADGLELLDWLRERVWPYEASLDEEAVATASLLGGAELLRSGTTTILDMGTVHHTDAIFEACAALGLRATIGKAMMDAGDGVPDGLRESTDWSMAESVRLADRWHGEEKGRLRYAFAPRFVLSVSDALLDAVVKEARRRGLRLHTHASENRNEVEAVRARFGRDNIELLAERSVLGKNCVLAHAVWISEHEEDLLARTGSHVVHCPSSNLKLGSGIARVPELLAKGVNVGLASDGAACNNNLDEFQEMRLATLIQGPRIGPSALSPSSVFEMATLRGASALGLEQEIGSLEVGKRADVVVIDPRRFHATPARDAYSTLVFSLHGSDVEHVFIDGIQRVRSGVVLGIDEERLLAGARDWSERMD